MSSVFWPGSHRFFIDLYSGQRRIVTRQRIQVPPLITLAKPSSIRHITAACIALASLLFCSPSSWALIEYSKSQRETIIQLVDQLEHRHYAKLSYDDALSSAHLDAFLDALDPGRMFLTAADIREFEPYRTVMDDELPKGNLRAGYAIFNRFQERLINRLENVIAQLDAQVATMDFSRDEAYALDLEDREWAADNQQLDERWRKQVKNQVLRLRLADKASEDIVPTLKKRYTNQLKRIRQYNSQDVFQVYANALAQLYDPHTNYLSPRRSENFNINMSLSLEGIGAVLQMEDEYTKVARLITKGPADKQGELKPSDRIVGVGQGNKGDIEDVIGWRLDEVVEKIRGPKDTTVRLEVIPAKSKTADERKVITIVRNKVKLEEQSAQKKVLEIPRGDTLIKLGVIDIPAFYIDFDAYRRGDKDYKSTTRDVRNILEELKAEDVDGIVIDLRSNGGGSLQEANELTGLFIEFGPTVQIRYSNRRVSRQGKRIPGAYYDGPLVVLVDRLSASASEIFAGAVQDYERGIIVGDRSFGKGTVQSLVRLSEGQLKITESKFYRISGESTQHRGVVPDIVFPSLYDTKEIGESALEHALNWDQINPVKHRRYDDYSTVLPQVTAQYRTRSEHNPDFIYLKEQIALAQQARDLTSLPLNEQKREALKNEQEAAALRIENKRRKAKGEPVLQALEENEGDEETAQHADTDQDINDDVLLMEAGNVLADVLVLRQQRYAAHNDTVAAP